MRKNSTVNLSGFYYFLCLLLFLAYGSAFAQDVTLLKDINPVANGIVSPLGLTNVNGVLYFVADDGTNGYELWKSDGTPSGTVMVKDIYQGIYYNAPGYLTNVNGVLYFKANDGVNGNELWKSDGTAAGTVMVKDINPGATGSNLESLINVNGVLYFMANDGVNGNELWKSDGTAAGTVMVKDIFPGANNSSPYNLTNVNGVLYFIATDGVNGYELWKSDGTLSGTVMVKDIFPGTGATSPLNLTNVNGVLYFVANDGINGNELWRSDGTAAGTVMVKDIRLGTNGTAFRTLANVNGVLYFVANDGINGYGLWKSDGTSEGTVIVKEIYSGVSGFSSSGFTNVNGVVYFFTSVGISITGLWKSDGTSAGTVMVTDIFPKGGFSYPELINFNGVLYCRFNDGINGDELWRSDGTSAGTVMVKDINLLYSSSPYNLTNVNGVLYFVADDGIHGQEIWRTYFPATISTTGTLTAFTACAGTASAEQSFTVSGSSLTANILVTAPTGFEVSTTSGSGFGSSVTLPQSGGSVGTTTIYVRMSSTATGTPSGNVSCTSTDAAVQVVVVSGTVKSYTLTAGTVTHPTTCGGAGSIAFTTTLPSGTYTLSYKKGGVAQSASVIVGSSIRVAVGAAIGNSFTLSGISAGNYTDFKIVYSGCEATASGPAVLSDPSGPTAFSVTGGGSFCTGGTGLPVSLSSSQTGVNYQLKRGSDNVGSAMPGTGSALLFGTQSTTGTYTVVATNTMTLCSTTMTGSAVINNYPQPTASLLGNASVCKDGAPALVSFTATAGSAPYQFNYKINNGVTQVVTSNSATVMVPQATNVAGVFVYSLVSMQDGNGCSQTQNGSITVNVLTRPSITLTTNGQTLLEGNTQTLCDIDANAVNGLQFTVTTACMAGSPVWRVQVGSGAWSDWATNAPVSQPSNNQAHRYQAACDATCPNTYTSPIELTMNYRASVPQNVSLSADGTTVGAGEEKSICDQSGTALTFSATCGAGERLLYSVDGGDYLPTVPSQIVDGQSHNYRVRCQKSDGTPSCVETESGAMRLKISVISGAPIASLNVSSGCGLPASFSGTATCPAGFSTVWYASATNVALPSLPATTPSVTTSYYARCQNEAGCQSGNSNTVTYTVTSVNEAPVVTVSSELVCTGQEVTISTSCPAGSTVLWSTGVSENSFSVSFNNITTQSYTARCVFGNGCQSAVSAAKTVRWKAFELTIINIGQSQSAVKSNDRSAWVSQFVTPDGGPILDQSSQSNPTLYYSENLNKTGPRYWTVNVEACALGTGGSLTFDMLITPETGVPQSFNTHENNAPYFMYANRDGWTELYAQNHPSYGFYQDNGAGSNMYNAGLPKGLYKLGVRYWDMKGWGSIYPSTRKPQGNVLAYQEYWFRIQSKDGVGVGAARTAAENGQWKTDNGFSAQVAPNPISNTLHLKVNEVKGQKVNVSLTDAVGRTLLKRNFVPETNQHQEAFEVGELANGMYFLQVNAGDKQAILKVIKVQ